MDMNINGDEQMTIAGEWPRLAGKHRHKLVYFVNCVLVSGSGTVHNFIDLQHSVIPSEPSLQSPRIMSTLAYINTPPPTPHQLAIAHLASRLYPRSKVRPADVDAWFNKNAKYHHAMLQLISREALFVSP
jgi:hypothetical protein